MTPRALSSPVTKAKGVIDKVDKSPFVVIKKTPTMAIKTYRIAFLEAFFLWIIQS